LAATFDDCDGSPIKWAVADRIIGVAFEGDAGMVPLHPLVGRAAVY
jgi:hypothetical protein